MNIDPQTILDKLNQLPIHLQQEVLNYIDFLIFKYGTSSPPIELKETSTTSEENSKETPIETIALEGNSEKASTLSVTPEENPKETTVLEENPKDNTVEVISEEDAKLDEEIAKIEEKNKRRITADWEELKSDFLDEFNR